MPRYYFDLKNDIVAPDPEGKELPDLEAAKIEALKDARELIGANIEIDGSLDLRHHIDVRDENGKVLHILWFEDALVVRRGDQKLSQPSSEA